MNPVTPMRSIPGAYFNTPAPGANTAVRRRLNFNSDVGDKNQKGGLNTGAPPVSETTIMSTTGSQPKPPKEEISPVEKAAQTVNRTLQQDESYPDLDSYCRPGASSEYELQYADAPSAPFQKVNMHAIPDQIFERLNMGEVNTKLGLFASLGYAWASIDSSLFLWDYSHPSPELIGYEDAHHPITAVALVAPKPGVFVSTITHILAVATTSDVVLLGMEVKDTPSGFKTVTLYQTKMAVHRGGGDVSFIRGTASGRIFFGGASDTDVYELSYQTEERWFSNRCTKINDASPGWSSVVPMLPALSPRRPEHLIDMCIDDTRNLLYTLSSKSTIRTYHLEAPNKLTSVIEKDKHSCLRDIAHMIEQSPLLTDRMHIVSLSPISAPEASKLHLVAVTNTGCRLHLSATSASSYLIGVKSNLAPQSMQVQFVKFPPRADPQSKTGGREGVVDIASRMLEPTAAGIRFGPGYFFAVVRTDENPTADQLFVSAPDTGRIKGTTAVSALKYYEQGNWIDIGNGNRALDVGLTTAPFAAAAQPLGFGNELAVQFDQAAGEFAILTSTGIHIVRRKRFVDILAAFLSRLSGEEVLENELRKFVAQYSRAEVVAAGLAVACGEGSDLRTGAGRTGDQLTEDRGRAVFIDHGGRPRLNETDTDGGQSATDSIQLSARHDGLALYLTRLVRLLWKSKVVTIKPTKTGLNVSSTIPPERLGAIQQKIERLRKFLDLNKAFIHGLTGPSAPINNRQEEIALQKEHQALHSLWKLMESVSEGISFALMLFDERVTDIFTRLDEASQAHLKDLTYESLFSQKPGRELAKVLVKAIVNRNIASGTNVETVADALRRRCGSFCSPDDVVIFKAQEQLQRAVEQQKNPSALRTILGESLRLFQQVANSLSASNLEGAVQQFVELKYYAGAIQLCLVVAQERDRGNVALTWINEGKPPNDPREGKFRAREACYHLIHAVLDNLEAVAAKEPEVIDGRLTLTGTKMKEAYNVVNDSNDEVFHFDLYEWYIKRNWTDRILAIDSPHVVTYLQRLAGTDARHATLLCRFYTQRNRFFDAAQVQADLAKSQLDIGIKDRIMFLSQAKGNASVNTVGARRQDQQLLNHEVTELLEIAHIQDDLLGRLLEDPRLPDERKAEVAEALDGPILSLTELFNNYADQANYYDLCLIIYHTADYQSPATIEETWDHLIDAVHAENEKRHYIWELYQSGQPLPEGIPKPTGRPPLPYESLSTEIQSIAHRTSLDSLIFPVDKLLEKVCKYAVEQGQDASIGADPGWPVLLFLSLGVAHSLVVTVLESLFERLERPFDRNRKLVIQWIMVVVESWVREVERRGAGGRAGDSSLGSGIAALLVRADAYLGKLPATPRTQEGEETTELRRRLRQLIRTVDMIIGAEPFGGSVFR